MSSLVPATLGWLVLGYVGAITLGRLMLLRDKIIDQLINHNLLWSIAALLCYRCAQASVTSPVYVLALGCVEMTKMHLFVIGRYILAETDSTVVWRLRRFSCSRASMSCAWATSAPRCRWSAGCWASAAASSRVVALSIAQLLTGRPALGPHLPGGELDFVLCVTLLAIPLLSALRTLAGCDRDARICRRLRPLWRDLTAAVPEIVLPADARHGADSVTRPFRMTVEIRDALLHLGSYLPAETLPPH